MIIVVGDSIAVGQHLDPPDVPWPVLLKVDEPVLVAAVPGDTTRKALERFPHEVQEHEAEVVLIAFGHNDCNRWETDHGLMRVSAGAFTANLHEMIDRVRAMNSVPYLISLIPSRRNERHALDTQFYDGLIRQVAKARGIVLIDVWEPFTRHDLGYTPDDLYIDGLHLSGAGHRLYADIVSRVLA